MKDFVTKSQYPQGKKSQTEIAIPFHSFSKLQAFLFFLALSFFSLLSNLVVLSTLWKLQPLAPMEKQHHKLGFVCMLILSLGLVSFSACIASELKKTKAKDLRLDGKLCYLPSSVAFGLGIVASICLVTLEVIGNSVIFMQLRTGEKKSSESIRKQRVAISLVILSWISTGFALLLLGVATSMNQKQPYGKGWLDGDCYIVKDGMYTGAGALVMITTIFILGSIFATTNTRFYRKQVEQGGKKVYMVR